MNLSFENKYFNTYYYANIISNILSEDIELIGFISNFFADEEVIFSLVQPFEKKSALHTFIQYIINDFFEVDMEEYDKQNFPKSLYVDIALREFGLGDFSFKDFTNEKKDISYSDAESYKEELRILGTLEELYEKISCEIFYLLFNNREALLKFNHIVADHLKAGVKEIEDDETRLLFNDKGTLIRTHIPEWCKRAVYFRDRGKCCSCFKDLSGILSLENEKHFDHIIPLALGGLNDVTNLQLLCSGCNLIKGSTKITTSNIYESWY